AAGAAAGGSAASSASSGSAPRSTGVRPSAVNDNSRSRDTRPVVLNVTFDDSNQGQKRYARLKAKLDMAEVA
ncbi:MAG: hypothetical protein ACPGWS_09190, partial [Solirubrobacterales bacterium]